MSEHQFHNQANGHRGQLLDRQEWQGHHTPYRHMGHISVLEQVQPLNIRYIEDYNRLGYEVLADAITEESRKNNLTARRLPYRINTILNPDDQDPASGNNAFLDPDITDDKLQRWPEVLKDTEVRQFIDNREVFDEYLNVLKIWPEFTAVFAKGVRYGINQGYIPSHVESQLDDSLALTKVRVADNAFLKGAAGVYNESIDEVRVTRDLTSKSDVFSVLAHEFVHKISGGTFVNEHADKASSRRLRAGFATVTENPDKYLRQNITEAITDYVAMGILTGDYETIDPDQYHDFRSSYHNELKLVSEFIGRSNGLVSMKMITNAFFEDTGPGGSFKNRKSLIRGTAKAYGPGALRKLEMLCALANGHVHSVVSLASRIHPPVMDEQGRIVQRGWIDVEDLLRQPKKVPQKTMGATSQYSEEFDEGWDESDG